MAIDTKAKRMNMLSFASPLAWGHLFEVDGAVDADDRAHLLHLYGGNALANPTPTTAGAFGLVNSGLVNSGLVNSGLVS